MHLLNLVKGICFSCSSLLYDIIVVVSDFKSNSDLFIPLDVFGTAGQSSTRLWTGMCQTPEQ